MNKSILAWLIVGSFLLTSCVGPQGPQGPRGIPGEPGVSGYEQVDFKKEIGDLAQNHVANGTAKCPAGKKVLGGGGYLLYRLESGQVVRALWPIQQSEPWHEDGWEFAIRQPNPSVVHNAEIHIVAICADVTP